MDVYERGPCAPSPAPFGDRTDILTLQSSPDPLWLTLATIFYEHSQSEDW